MSCYFCRLFPSSVPPCHAGSYHQKCMFCACPASLSSGKDGYLSHPSSQSRVRSGRAGVYHRCVVMSASDDRDSTADGGLGLLVEDVVRVMHRRLHEVARLVQGSACIMEAVMSKTVVALFHGF